MNDKKTNFTIVVDREVLNNYREVCKKNGLLISKQLELKMLEVIKKEEEKDSLKNNS